VDRNFGRTLHAVRATCNELNGTWLPFRADRFPFRADRFPFRADRFPFNAGTLLVTLSTGHSPSSEANSHSAQSRNSQRPMESEGSLMYSQEPVTWPYAFGFSAFVWVFHLPMRAVCPATSPILTQMNYIKTLHSSYECSVRLRCYEVNIRGCIQKFPDWVDNEITMNTRWEAIHKGSWWQNSVDWLTKQLYNCI
jgi:hypothetical protein